MIEKAAFLWNGDSHESCFWFLLPIQLSKCENEPLFCLNHDCHFDVLFYYDYYFQSILLSSIYVNCDSLTTILDVHVNKNYCTILHDFIIHQCFTEVIICLLKDANLFCYCASYFKTNMNGDESRMRIVEFSVVTI